MTTELRRGFHDDIAALHERVYDLAVLVSEGITDATVALLDGDVSLADAVVAADAQVDAVYSWVESEVFGLVARQAPVARDLRFLIATLRIAQSVERAGDLTASIARRTVRVDLGAMSQRVRALVLEMGSSAQAAFRAAADCYAVLDAQGAAALPAADDHIDDLQRRLLHELVASAPEADLVESVVDLALIARFYERIGDHAVVVAERVRFVASGEMDASDRDEAT